MREGVRPDGAHYFPAFPCTSYVLLPEAAALAMKAYLFSLPAVDRASRPHEIPFPLNWRFLQGIWKSFFSGAMDPVRPGLRIGEPISSKRLRMAANAERREAVLGGLERDLWMAGTVDGPDGKGGRTSLPIP